MTNTKIDPRRPGQSTAGDDFCNPHGHAGSPGTGGHIGMERGDDGSFNTSSFSRGGVSSDGEAMVEKYRPGRKSSGSSDTIPSGSSLNEEGDGYD